VTASAGAPGTVRVGVTGHRTLADPTGVERRVGDALTWIAAQLGGSPPSTVRFTAVSSLAEGADRVVAHRILAEPDAELEALLPLPPGDYAVDFIDASSREEFRALLTRARWTVVSTQPRPAAYEDAGRRVVDAADVLLAVWDGEPSRGRGGTAEIVAYARRQGRPVFVVDPDGASIEHPPSVPRRG
jgi:hypothetical protein